MYLIVTQVVKWQKIVVLSFPPLVFSLSILCLEDHSFGLYKNSGIGSDKLLLIFSKSIDYTGHGPVRFRFGTSPNEWSSRHKTLKLKTKGGKERTTIFCHFTT